jgi:hypothetical protein
MSNRTVRTLPRPVRETRSELRRDTIPQVSQRTKQRAVATLGSAMVTVNAAILGALAVLSFNPQRAAFGRVTGLWHACLPPLDGRTGYERWSPVLLVLVVPAALGFIIASRLGRPAATILQILSAMLAFVAVGLVLVPTGSCIA